MKLFENCNIRKEEKLELVRNVRFCFWILHVVNPTFLIIVDQVESNNKNK